MRLLTLLFLLPLALALSPLDSEHARYALDSSVALKKTVHKSITATNNPDQVNKLNDIIHALNARIRHANILLSAIESYNTAVYDLESASKDIPQLQIALKKSKNSKLPGKRLEVNRIADQLARTKVAQSKAIDLIKKADQRILFENVQSETAFLLTRAAIDAYTRSFGALNGKSM